MTSRRQVLRLATAGAAFFMSAQAGRAVGLLGTARSPGSTLRASGPGAGPAIVPAPEPDGGRVVIPGLANSGIAPPPPPPPPPTPVPVPSDARFEEPAVFQRGDPSGQAVYLTMDDCYLASAVVNAMDVAERYGARLTFFPYAQVMAKSPDLWRDVLGRGHGIENHTLSHKTLPSLSDQALYDEVQGWNRVAREVLGDDYAAKFFRPPGGAGVLGKLDERVPRVATQLAMKIALWSADSQGWRSQAATDPVTIARIAANALAGFGPGSLVLQHALDSDVLALPAILEEAKRRGLECKPLREGLR